MKMPDEEDMPVTDEPTNKQKSVTIHAPTASDPTTEERPHQREGYGRGQYTQDTAHAANTKHNQRKDEGPEAPPTNTPRDRTAPNNGYPIAPRPWDSDQHPEHLPKWILELRDIVDQSTPGKELQHYVSSKTSSLGQTPKN